MVEPRIDQFQRQDRHAETLADPLVAADVAADAVAGEQGVAAEEGVAGAFEVIASGRCSTVKPWSLDQASKMRALLLPDVVPEPSGEEPVVEDQAGVGGEDEVGQPRLRLDQFDRHAELDERVVELLPLPPRGSGSLPAARSSTG